MRSNTNYHSCFNHVYTQVRAAKKQYKDGVLIAESKLSSGESKMAGRSAALTLLFILLLIHFFSLYDFPLTAIGR